MGVLAVGLAEGINDLPLGESRPLHGATHFRRGTPAAVTLISF